MYSLSDQIKRRCEIRYIVIQNCRRTTLGRLFEMEITKQSEGIEKNATVLRTDQVDEAGGSKRGIGADQVSDESICSTSSAGKVSTETDGGSPMNDGTSTGKSHDEAGTGKRHDDAGSRAWNDGVRSGKRKDEAGL